MRCDRLGPRALTVRPKPDRSTRAALVPSHGRARAGYRVKRNILIASGTAGLMARLLYGSGMRVTECARLRIKDVDLQRRTLTVRSGKGGKDRVTVLPDQLLGPVRGQIERAQLLYQQDRAAGVAGVFTGIFPNH